MRGFWDLTVDEDDALTLSDYDADLRVPLQDPIRGSGQVVELEPDPFAWMADAACRGRTEAMYAFTYLGTGWQRNHEIDEAKKVCAGCPVRHECLDYALDQRLEDIRFGVWAGMERHELERERRARRRRAA